MGRRSIRREADSPRPSHDDGISSSLADQARTLHYGFARSVIDMPTPMIKAWIADAHSLRGYREIEGGEIESVTKYRLDEFNDHSYVDYRRSAGFWPIQDREAVLYHISKDMDDGR